jgi:hypothetical protein
MLGFAAAEMCFLDRSRGCRTRLAVTLRYETEQEHRDYECDHSSLGRREAKSLPHFIEFETAAFLNQIANASKGL